MKISDETLDIVFNETAAKTIKKYREQAGMSLEDVVAKMKEPVSRQMLYKYENNLARMKNKIFIDICNALKINPDNIFYEINFKTIELANEINNQTGEIVDIPLIDKDTREIIHGKVINNILFDNATPTQLPKDVVKIPVLGRIPAGVPLEAIEDILGYEEIPRNWLKGGKEYFALILDGDSMEPKYQDKDIGIFLKTSNCESGQDCCIKINGFDATFKRVKKQDNGIMVIPLNENNSTGFSTTFFTNDEIISKPVEIIGVIKQIRRNM